MFRRTSNTSNQNRLCLFTSDEVLSEFVIYDKRDPGHMDKICVSNAWKEIVEKCGGEETSIDLQKQFKNIKKRYQKRDL